MEHDSLPENATGWNLTWTAMMENNISINSTYSTWGNYVTSIAGFDVPEDSSWWWELHTWNETSDAWEASTVGVDSVMIGDHRLPARAPNLTDDQRFLIQEMTATTTTREYLFDMAVNSSSSVPPAQRWLAQHERLRNAL